MHSAECRLFSQVTSESPQFTNLDNSIDIADRIGELYVVDSYYVLCRFEILLRQMRIKIWPPSSTMDAGSLYLTRHKNRTTRHQLNRTIWFGIALVRLKLFFATWGLLIGDCRRTRTCMDVQEPERQVAKVCTIKDCIDWFEQNGSIVSVWCLL